MRSIDLIVIHCSATPNGVWVSPEQIDRWHQQRGFQRKEEYARRFCPALPHIGYHRLILANGQAAIGRQLEEIGAHVAGHNASSIGVCMVGTSAFFEAQWAALRDCLGALVIGLAERAKERVPDTWWPIPGPEATKSYLAERGIRVCGHRDLSPDLDGDGLIEPHEWLKTCPGFDVAAWMERGMQPEPVNVLDEHPALAQVGGLNRAVSSMRYGV